MTAQRVWGVRLALLVVVLSSFAGSILYLARARERSERSTMPVLRSATLSQSPSLEHGSETGIALRLLDRLDQAQISAPRQSERAERGLLAKHWRRHRLPYTGPSGELGRLAQAVGLTEALEVEPARAATASDLTLAPAKRQSEMLSGDGRELDERDLRTFGLGEGSHDQRESLLVAAPATLRFKLHIPANAKLRLAPAVIGSSEVSFSISFHSDLGVLHPLGTTTLRGPSKHFRDWVIDLQAAGVGAGDGELELSCESKSHEPALALWGDPVVVAPKASRLPYNVLFIIVDAMRSDAISAAHDASEDRARKLAQHQPLEAWIDSIPEVAPELDKLAASGVIWPHSWSAAMWTRPSTIALLTGRRASQSGLEVLALELLGDQRQRFYASRPPLLPLFLRRAGASTTAIVNNMYLSGSVGVGVDCGFEMLIDHRLKALDTRRITRDALRFLEARGNERFLLLLNYASPHAPYVPPHRDVRALRGAANLPSDPSVVNYLAEIHKDDAAIGQVLTKLDELKLREQTLVIVTADHGETLSVAHDAVAVDVAQGVPSGRFTHLSTMWEEAARVPIIMALPGKIPSRRRLESRVEAIDILPTILELQGLPIPDEVQGRSLVPDLRGTALEQRPVVIEGRGARSIIEGKYHLIVRDPIARKLRRHDEELERAFELYDLEQDPGERREVALQYPEVVAELKTKLDRIVHEGRTDKEPASGDQRFHFRFASSGVPRQLEVTLQVGAAAAKVTPVGIDARGLTLGPDAIRISTLTSKQIPLGFDLQVPSARRELRWSVSLAGKPWPSSAVFVGPLGVSAPQFAQGYDALSDLSALDSTRLPHIVATEELGLFVTRDPVSGTADSPISAEAQLEAQQAMQAWGYARGPAKSPGPPPAPANR